jgi:hypothetical protein
MTRRAALLLLFALATLPGSGCYHLRNCVARFRANHPCLAPCGSAYPIGVGCGVGCGVGYGAGYVAGHEGCPTCQVAPPMGQAYPAAMFGMPQPLPNPPAADPKAGMPNPMK